MYVRRLQVRNLKRLRDFSLDFTHGGQPRMWTVLIGENGTAKTTLLHALALSAAGSKQVNTLAGPVVKYLRDRRSEERLFIETLYDFTPLSVGDHGVHPLIPKGRLSDLHLRSEVTLERGSTSLDARAEYVHLRPSGAIPIATDRDPLDAARDVHSPLWFVAGYGISRVLPDPIWIPPLVRPSIERLQPLFDTRAILASTSFANHFLNKDIEEGRKRGTTSRMYGRILNEAIRLGGTDILPDVIKLELRGQGGANSAERLIESDRFNQRMGSKIVQIPGVALSHGYQSTFAWIADLIGNILLESRTEIRTVEMEGLVLVDEIDLYLHPTWQSTFVTALRRVFPRIQFVATTHSPAVLAGLAPHEIVRLISDRESGDVVRGVWDTAKGQLVRAGAGEPSQPDPRSMTGSELYRNWFAIDRLTPNPLGEQLRQYKLLASDPDRTERDNAELERLQRQLTREGIELEPEGKPRGRRDPH